MRRMLSLIVVFGSLIATTPFAQAADPIKMAGNLSYFRKGGVVDLSCGQIANYRSSTLMSGTLVLQLMAATSSTATPKAVTFKMCEVQIGKLQGHTYRNNVKASALFKAPTPGTYYILFVLSEWNGVKYVPIDWYMFSNPKKFTTTSPFQFQFERIPGT